MIFAEISRREALVADVAAAARELEKAAAYPDRCSSNFDCLEGFATVAQTWQGLALELGMEERSIDQFRRELTAALVFLRRLSLLRRGTFGVGFVAAGREHHTLPCEHRRASARQPLPALR